MIGWLYQKIFIAIVNDGGVYDVRIRTLKQKKLLSNKAKSFEGESAFEEMISFVRKQMEESPLHYVSLLNPNHNQGAVSGCSYHENNDSLSGAQTLCRNDMWTLYASIRELDELQKHYSTIGLDFIFSPFSLIERFFADKISGGVALYTLAQKDGFSIAFFEEGKLEYAHHYPMHTNKISTVAEDPNPVGFSLGVEEEHEKGISLDEIESLDDLDIIDELDDLSDIADLDSLEEIVEFSEDAPTTVEQHTSFPHVDEVKGELDRFNDDYARFELIEKALSEFYAGEHCKNRFIETVYVADAYGSGGELKRYLEEELFLNVLIRRIDVGDEVMALSIAEEGEL